jgi:hypothetical protein
MKIKLIMIFILSSLSGFAFPVSYGKSSLSPKSEFTSSDNQRPLSKEEYPLLFDYPKGGVILYRGFSWHFAREEVETRVDIDRPEYNSLVDGKRLGWLRKILNEKGYIGLFGMQLNQFRIEKTARLTMSWSEDIAQVLYTEGYGRTVLKKGDSSLRLFAVFKPDPAKTPVLLARKIFSFTPMYEAAVFNPAGTDDKIEWYFVAGSNPKRLLKIKDQGKLRGYAKKWESKALSEQGDEHGDRFESVMLEDIDSLIEAGVLEEDKLLENIAGFDYNAYLIASDFDNVITGLWSDRRLFHRNQDFSRIVESLRKYFTLLLEFRDDPFVQHSFGLFREKILTMAAGITGEMIGTNNEEADLLFRTLETIFREMGAGSFSESLAVHLAWEQEFFNDLNDAILARYKSLTYNGPVEIHGYMHVYRSLMWGQILVNIYNSYAKKYRVPAMEFDRKLLAAIALHDSGRQGEGKDRWTEDSLRNIKEFLIEQGEDPAEVGFFINRLQSDKWSPEKMIFKAADSVDIMRPHTGLGEREGFDFSRFAFLRDDEDPLVREMRSTGNEKPDEIRTRIADEAYLFIMESEEQKRAIMKEPGRFMQNLLRRFRHSENFLNTFLDAGSPLEKLGTGSLRFPEHGVISLIRRAS